MQVTEILASKGTEVVTTNAEVTVEGIVRLLRAKNIGAVVVLEEKGQVGGMLSERDVVRALALHGEGALSMRVGDLMTRHVQTCRPDDDCREIMSLMTEHRVRHLPVVDGGRLAGIISIGDVVKQRLAEIEAEAETLREYITAR